MLNSYSCVTALEVLSQITPNKDSPVMSNNRLELKHADTLQLYVSCHVSTCWVAIANLSTQNLSN